MNNVFNNLRARKGRERRSCFTWWYCSGWVGGQVSYYDIIYVEIFISHSCQPQCPSATTISRGHIFFYFQYLTKQKGRVFMREWNQILSLSLSHALNICEMKTQLLSLVKSEVKLIKPKIIIIIGCPLMWGYDTLKLTTYL